MNINAEIEQASKRVTDWINRSAGQHIRAMKEKQVTLVDIEETVSVKKLNANAQLPSYATKGAACFDLRACIDSVITLQPGAQTVIGTGLAFAVPSGYVMNVVSRSGHTANARVTVSNSPGKVDSDYRGEVKIILRNDGNQPFIVRNGDRIAQAEIVSAPQWTFVAVDSLDATERGDGGFGHTGAA